jgi:hypothetical protein
MRRWRQDSGRRAPCRCGTLRVGLTIAAAAAALAGAVLVVLHPLVLPRPLALAQMRATIDNWQTALLLPLPSAFRQAGHAPPAIFARLDALAARRLREVGTASFAAQQAGRRRASPAFILKSSYDIRAFEYLGHAADGDVLVRVMVVTQVQRAMQAAKPGTWGRPWLTVTAEDLVCRLQASLGVWRIVGVEPR